jgi:hypothetical protein
VQQRDGLRHSLPEHPRAERTTHHEQAHLLACARLGIGRIGDRGNVRAHRIAGHCPAIRWNRVGELHLIEAQSETLGARREEAVGAAHHGVLFVQQGRDIVALRGGEWRNGRISAEPDNHCGIEAAKQSPRLHVAQAKTREVAQARDQPLAGNAARCDAMHLHLRQPVAEAAATLIGREIDLKATRQQRPRQRFRREHMAAGAAGRQQDAGRNHVSRLPGKRLRVSASSMPTPSAMAMIEEPP